MTQEDKRYLHDKLCHERDKELLLKDLCARLPYGVKVNVIYSNENASSFRQRVCVEGDNELNTDIIGLYQCNEIEIKPYLFPLSSMTEEQWRELFETAGYEVREEDCGRHTEMYYYDMVGHDNTLYPNCDDIDWLNKNHFDYRGLIEKGLALDATGLNIY